MGLIEYIGGPIQSIFRGSRHPPRYLHTGAALKIGKSHAKSKRLPVAAGIGLVEYKGQPIDMNMDTHLIT